MRPARTPKRLRRHLRKTLGLAHHFLELPSGLQFERTSTHDHGPIGSPLATALDVDRGFVAAPFR